MDLREAVRRAVERTGHHRFAALLDPAHADYNPAYEPAVRALAAGQAVTAEARPAPVHDLATIARLKPLAAACLYAAEPGWRGCGCRHCFALGRSVSLRECLDCTGALVPVSL